MGTIAAAAAATCWLCAFIAIPRKPLVADEGQELVYARLLGRQQRLVLLAGLLSAALLLAVVLGLPQRVERENSAAPIAPVGATSSWCNDEMVCPWMYERQ